MFYGVDMFLVATHDINYGIWNMGHGILRKMSIYDIFWNQVVQGNNKAK